MAGWDPTLMTPSLVGAPTAGSGLGAGLPTAGASVQPHHGLVALVLVAALVVVLLDRAGFRFAVTVGRS